MNPPNCENPVDILFTHEISAYNYAWFNFFREPPKSAKSMLKLAGFRRIGNSFSKYADYPTLMACRVIEKNLDEIERRMFPDIDDRLKGD